MLLGFVGRPWWVVLVAAAALTIASLEYVEARVQAARGTYDSAYLRSVANNAGDSLAYSSLAYIVGWLMASIAGFA